MRATGEESSRFHSREALTPIPLIYAESALSLQDSALHRPAHLDAARLLTVRHAARADGRRPWRPGTDKQPLQHERVQSEDHEKQHRRSIQGRRRLRRGQTGDFGVCQLLEESVAVPRPRSQNPKGLKYDGCVEVTELYQGLEKYFVVHFGNVKSPNIY